MNPIRALSSAAGAVAIVAASAIVLSGDECDRICRPGAAQAGRPSPEAWLKLRQEVFSFPAHHAEYEVDHIVPRCLDGLNTVEEAEVRRTYCVGKITLEEGSGEIQEGLMKRGDIAYIAIGFCIGLTVGFLIGLL